MAKKIDASKQGEYYLQNLFGGREITPIEEAEDSAKINEKDIQSPETILSVKQIESEHGRAAEQRSTMDDPQDDYNSNPRRRGRKRNGDAPKITVSISMNQNLFNNLKKVAFMNHLKVSNIVEEYIERYVAYHSDDIEEFDRLPEIMKERAGL